MASDGEEAPHDGDGAPGGMGRGRTCMTLARWLSAHNAAQAGMAEWARRGR